MNKPLFQGLKDKVAVSTAGGGLRSSTLAKVLAPGFFLNHQNRSLLTRKDVCSTDRKQIIVDHALMESLGEPEGLIGTTLWLCSEHAKFVTRIIVPTDGGFSAFSSV